MKNKHELFFPNLKLFMLLLVLMRHGIVVHGLGIDQARSIMALGNGKMPFATSYTDDHEWSTEMSLYSEMTTTSYDVGNMEDDLIKNGLPGQPPSNSTFKQYAGYVNVDDGKGRTLFYYFAEAAEDPSSKPLILWLNGGPGCSSLGMGAMLEIGPFGVNPDGKTLYARRFAWNKVANTLFLESPAGVGFSYSNTTSDYRKSGDKRTAQDAYTFLINWFKRYPHYKSRDFYIAGESYAGFYIPELADLIIKKNARTDSTSKIQLKGVMIGNGIMNLITDRKGKIDYLWSHALMSDENYNGILKNCMTNISKACEYFLESAGRGLGVLDLYNIYGPLCWNSPESSPRKTKSRYGYDPCERDYVYSYLNLPEVQAALHANKTRLPYSWELCSVVIENWNDSPSTMFPIYRRLIASGLRILLYSGDVDAVVPVTSTRYSINALNLKVLKQWLPWSDNSTKEVAGYRVVYDGLTFTTVRGAGHQVPQFQPRRAFALLKLFLRNQV